MNSLRFTKLPALAATVLLSASLSFADPQTDPHAKPEHHKAHKAAHHTAPKTARHDESKVAHPKTPKPAQQKSKKARKHHTRGQQAIDNERARQIQEALVREHYMSVKPSGAWDSATQEAMRRYQADHGWQTKTVPDSRALIRLGLGPDHGHLLNPESAMTSEPQLPHGSAARSISSAVASGPVARSSSSIVAPAQSSSSISAATSAVSAPQ
jgi:Putative peptidoglycan binding domain